MISLMKAEYIATMEASKEHIWLNNLTKKLGKKQKSNRLFSDSQSVIHLEKNSVFHQKTKHINKMYHFTRSLLEEQVHMDENLVDMFTKVVTVQKLEVCKASVGLRE